MNTESTQTSNNTADQEIDFGFRENDLQNDNDLGLNTERNDDFEGLKAQRPNEDDLYQAVVDDDTVMAKEPPTATFFSKYGMYIGVGVVALILMGGLGWIALKVLKPTPAYAENSNARGAFGAQSGTAKSQMNTGAVEPMQFGSERAGQGKERVQHAQGNVSSPEADDSLGSVLPITPRTEQEQDEQFYDELVSAATHNTPAPPVVESTTAVQAATPVQVNPETAEKFAAISVALANQSKDMATVLEAVKLVSEEIKALKIQADASSTKTNLFEGRLNQLNLSLTDLTKNTESRFNDISKAAVAAAIQAVKKDVSGKSGGNDKLVLVGGPIKSDYVSDKAKRVERKTNPKPMVVAAQPPVVSTPASAKPPTQPETGNQAAKCGAKIISQVWKVKGLTYSGAYVRRDDGSALMLRADMEVPGFGRVKSFDPESRTVCTTSGLIAR